MRRVLTVLAGIALVTALAALATAQGGRASVRGAGQERRAEHVVVQRPEQTRFGVEVLAAGGALEKYPARGRIYVEAFAGEEYAVRLSNPLPVRVAVALSVDGLNTIDARRTTARDASKWVIPPYGSITVSGWQMSSTRARRFYFTNERDSYANRIGRPSDLGVITAVFFRERPTRSQIYQPPRPLEAEPRGEDRSDAKRRQGSAAPPAASAGRGNTTARPNISRDGDEEYAATGIGRSVSNDVWSVQMDLESNPVSEVTLRYEYRDALVRLGVLPRNYPPRPDHLRRRERARGFEDGQFSPEP